MPTGGEFLREKTKACISWNQREEGNTEGDALKSL
jgi:hypothetical protein